MERDSFILASHELGVGLLIRPQINLAQPYQFRVSRFVGICRRSAADDS
jgi:hypothetical protein